VSCLRFHRLARVLPHPTVSCRASLARQSDRLAITPPKALRAANRKTGISMPEIQKPKSPARFTISAPHRQNLTRPENH
jgi:hypothetical protein